ncbi:LysR family transcriptional regulator [Cupriavidus sp. 2TAF22]|uniref:LysR family transcriptional regulator n=1 Tax=unclassified Cupriavidus TaxID=2640874 RepID=UPI003F8EE728
MDKVQAMEVFTRVVEMSSFSRAAEALGLSRTSATTIIQNLEAHLHVRLIHRTTRQLRLTAEGAEYYERCMRILGEIAETEVALTRSGKGPTGKLRIEMPASLGRTVVTPRLHTFHAKYPDIELVVGYGDKLVDLIQDGVDCAIRAGSLQDSSLVARGLGDIHTATVASPAYIHRHGMPRSLSDLQDHKAIHYISNRTGRTLDMNFVVDGNPVDVSMRGNVSFNSLDAYVTYGLSGAGILQPPRFMIQEHLRSGALVELLPQWRPRPIPVAVVYPQNRHLAPKVRVFVDWVAELFESCPLMAAADSTGEACELARSRVARADPPPARARPAVAQALAV